MGLTMYGWKLRHPNMENNGLSVVVGECGLMTRRDGFAMPNLQRPDGLTFEELLSRAAAITNNFAKDGWVVSHEMVSFEIAERHAANLFAPDPTLESVTDSVIEVLFLLESLAEQP